MTDTPNIVKIESEKVISESQHHSSIEYVGVDSFGQRWRFISDTMYYVTPLGNIDPRVTRHNFVKLDEVQS